MDLHYKIVNTDKLIWVLSADKVLAAAGCLAPWLLPKPQPIPQWPRRILAIRLAYLGDIVMTLPALEALKRQYPTAELHFLTSSQAAPLLRGNPFVDNVIVYDAPWFYGGLGSSALLAYRRVLSQLRGLDFDLAIDFRGDIRNIALILAQSKARSKASYTSGGGGRLLTAPVHWPRVGHKIEFHLDLVRALGIPAASSDPLIYVTTEELEAARTLLKREGADDEKQLVVIHPGARVQLKQWSVERFNAVARSLEPEGYRIAITGSKQECELSQAVAKGCRNALDLAGTLTIRQFAAVVAQAEALIGNDSAPIHLAAAVGTPTVAIFGPSKPNETAPRGERHRAVWSDCPDRDWCDENRCYNGSESCLDAVSVEMVTAAVSELLRQGKADE